MNARRPSLVAFLALALLFPASDLLAANGGVTLESVPEILPIGPKVLCIVTGGDDLAFRGAVTTITQGNTDYFDGHAGTPSAAMLSGYQCVYTFPDQAYSDRVLLGDRLADYVDAGGKVVLGVKCTYTTGNSLGGRIMTSAYCPVTSPTGTNHASLSAYAGDGFKSLHAGVLAYACVSRDTLILQGSGIANGHYADGEIAQAYRPDGRVMYSNGSGWSTVGGTGDWPKLLANEVRGNPARPGVLIAPSDNDDLPFRQSLEAVTGGVVDYFNAQAGNPSPALLATYDCIHVWASGPFFDSVVLGNLIADRVDTGGKAILGAFCTYTSGFHLDGRIMTADYCPVFSTFGTNHGTISNYTGDGVSPLFAGVSGLGTQYRDVLVGQGNGIVDGHTMDGEIVAAYRPDGHVVYVNGISTTSYPGAGDWVRLIGNACTATFPPGHRILYAPASSDPASFRAQVAAQTGGVVDFVNTALTTPSLAQLLNYDCVVLWVDAFYADRVLFGNNLADYVDAGGKVILGPFTLGYKPLPGIGLAGRIVTPAYCPVANPTQSNHYATSNYAGDGATCFDRGIVQLSTQYRDSLVLQGQGVADAHYADGEILIAYRPDRKVVFLNGIGAAGGDTGDWARAIANICDCGISNDVLYGCNDGGQYFVVNQKTGTASLAGLLPTSGISGANEFECMGSSGITFVQGAGNSYVGQRFHIGDGTPLADPIADNGSFDALEYALGRLYGTFMTSPCGNTLFGVLDPTVGTVTGLGITGIGQITGLAFDARSNALYGSTGICNGNAYLMRLDITSGQVWTMGSIGRTIGSLEFGPDGDLYAGGDYLDGGHLYRVGTVYGQAQLVGNLGFGGISGLTLAPAGTVSAGPTVSSLSLAAPYPNPSSKQPVVFSFSLPRGGDAQAELFDVRGRLVWRESLPKLEPGLHAFSWDGRTTSGRKEGPGIYLMHLTTPAGTRTARVIRLD